MAMTVHLPTVLVEALEAEATRRGQSPDQVAAQLLAERLAQAGPPRRRHLSFAGIGEEGIPAQTGVQENMQTPYTFGLYSLCGGLMHQALPEEWVTGSHTVTVLPPKAKKCSDHFLTGETFHTNDEKAGTFSAGVDLKQEIGVNLSAQSGYDKDTSITWTFPKGGGFLCGTNHFPPKAAWNVMDVSKSGNL